MPEPLETPRPGEALRVEAETVHSVGVVRVAGELDLAGAARVTGAVEEVADGERPLVLDLREVTFIDSTGVRTLLDIERTAGGPVALYGVWGNRGAVLSAQASAEAFAGWAGHAGPPEVTRLPDIDLDDGSQIEVRAWRGPSGPDVVLYRVEGGGHTFPNRTHPYPRFIGRTNADIDGAEEIWRFFSQQRR